MAKEKLNINRTPATLFVGVGGIGSEVIVRVAERCREGEARNIKFVVMDTNANDLRAVRGSSARVIPIQTSSTQSVIDYLNKDHDARDNWFPNNATLYPKSVSEGAGQVRSISRLALNTTIKTGTIAPLYKAIDDLFLKDGEIDKQALRVVIASSAAGGTGSGIAMITGMLTRNYLRKHYPEKTAIIRGFYLLPGVMDTVISTDSERETLRRNGYATIKEVNAFMIKASGFCNVRKEFERYRDLHVDVPSTGDGVERLDCLPFDFCFLLDRIDSNLESMQTLEQYEDFAAQSLYEQNIGPMQSDVFSMDDNIRREFTDHRYFGRNRFGAMGASTLRYPYEDIAEYVAYSRAIQKIGDGANTGEWLKYDRKFKEAQAEYVKKRAISSEREPRREDVYVSALENDDQRFGMDIKSYLTDDANLFKSKVELRINTFIKSFKEEMLNAFTSAPDIQIRNSAALELKSKKDYSNSSEQNKAEGRLNSLREFELMIKERASNISKSRAKSILYTAPSVLRDDMPRYCLESLLHVQKGCIHPNAVRYILYKLKKKMQEEYTTKLKDAPAKKLNDLQIYSSSASNENKFDVSYSRGVKEQNLDEVVALEKMDASFFEKLGGKQSLWDALNKHFSAYATILIEYRDAVLNEAAYDVAIEYLGRLCEEFEKFYESFESKVTRMEKAMDEIVDKLRFRKGDSVFNVCSTKECLEMLARSCPEGSDGLLLPVELNADIFEAVKKNAESRRLASYDPYGEHTIDDIFDSVLIDYFRESVYRDCDEAINLNIVKAISVEQKFLAIAEATRSSDDENAVSAARRISDERKLEYLNSRIDFGSRLASSGLNCASFMEPRVIHLCTYSSSFSTMRDIDIGRVVQSMKLKPVPSDTVSKYELRFFNALYNITPDILSKFKSPEECEKDELFSADAGIYYKAYHDYIKDIGPDSTKCATITLHIDKRWDSLTELPELSIDSQYNEMLHIHSALVYGVIHGMIRTHKSSRYDDKKRIYSLENMEGDLTPLIVSNKTECDEFYEVLDALYRDRESVSKIYDMVERHCKYDIESNHRYNESAFIKDTQSFRIGDGHMAPTSMFEIPLIYYNSLPRAKLDDNELSIMIDSVMHVIRTEVDRYEQESDRDSFYAKRLESQFGLLIENFKNDEYNEGDAMRKNTEIHDNRVINMVFRKISNVLRDLNAYRFNERIDELRSLIKE